MALFADVAHNVGDALTAVPVGAGFLLMNRRAERFSGVGVVAAIFVSACLAGYAAIERLINPRPLAHLLLLALGVSFLIFHIAWEAWRTVRAA